MSLISKMDSPAIEYCEGVVQHYGETCDHDGLKRLTLDGVQCCFSVQTDRHASLNTPDYCIGGMHLSIQNAIVLERCISQYKWYCIGGMHLSLY